MIDNAIELGGAVVFWTITDATDRLKLCDALKALQLESFVPEVRPPASVLREALERVLGGPQTLIRPLAERDGFIVVHEQRGKYHNTYQTTLVARIQDDRDFPLNLDPWDERAELVEQVFGQLQSQLSASQVSSCLVRIVESLGGIRLRPTGAIYWIPGPKLDLWQLIALAVEQSATSRPSCVYCLRHRLDGDAIRAIQDALVGEVDGATHRIEQEVYSGELGPRALETRKSQAQDLREKVVLYEELLQVTLGQLHKALDRTDQITATASLVLASQSLAGNTVVQEVSP